jgi:hypothetical protein
MSARGVGIQQDEIGNFAGFNRSQVSSAVECDGIFLVLESTIVVRKQGEKTTDRTFLVTPLASNPELKVSDQDLNFLKSLRIKIEEDVG